MRARGFALDQDLLRASNRVEFVGKSQTDPNIDLRVSFPDSFPSKAPHVHTTTAVQLKRHQRPDSREICTFGPTRARWSAILSSTAAIDEAETVIADVSLARSSEPKYLDDVPEPASALYYYQNNVFVLVSPAIAAFAAGMSENSSAPLKLRFENWPGETVSRTGPGRGIVTEVGLKLRTKAENWHERLVRPSLEIKGKIIRLAAPPPLTTNISDFNAWLHALGHERTDWMAFVFPEQSGNATTQRLAWLFVRSKHRVEHIRVEKTGVTKQVVLNSKELASRVSTLTLRDFHRVSRAGGPKGQMG